MMKLARETQKLAGEWLATFDATGLIDTDKIDAMVKVRQQITTAIPASDIEALLIAAAARDVAGYGYNLSEDNAEINSETLEAIRLAFAETTIALQRLKTYLETKTATNLEALGLFGEGATVQ